MTCRTCHAGAQPEQRHGEHLRRGLNALPQGAARVHEGAGAGLLRRSLLRRAELRRARAPASVLPVLAVGSHRRHSGPYLASRPAQACAASAQPTTPPRTTMCTCVHLQLPRCAQVSSSPGCLDACYAAQHFNVHVRPCACWLWMGKSALLRRTQPTAQLSPGMQHAAPVACRDSAPAAQGLCCR